jgi:hypothetical protein
VTLVAYTTAEPSVRSINHRRVSALVKKFGCRVDGDPPLDDASPFSKRGS